MASVIGDRPSHPICFRQLQGSMLTMAVVPFDREQVEARLALNLIASSDMPQMACDALEAGLDGKAIRRLAVLEKPTYFEVAEILPRVMQELEMRQIPTGEAALRVARQIAKDILSGGDDPLLHIRDFEFLWIRSGYPPEICALGTMYDDVYVAQSTGSSDDEIRSRVKSLLQNFSE